MPGNRRDLWLILHAKGMADKVLNKFKRDVEDVGKSTKLATLMAERAAAKADLTQRQYNDTLKKAELAQLANEKSLHRATLAQHKMNESLAKSEIAMLQNEKSIKRTEMAVLKLEDAETELIDELKLEILHLDDSINHKKQALIVTERLTNETKTNIQVLEDSINTKRKDILETQRQTVEARRSLQVLDDQIKKIRDADEQMKLSGDAIDVARRNNISFWRALITPNRALLSALRTGIPAVLGSPIGAAALALGAAFAVTFVAAFITTMATAGLGAAIVAAAVIGLVKLDERVEKSGQHMLDVFKKAFKFAIEPLAEPLLLAIKKIELAVIRMTPMFRQVFEAMKPAIEPLTEGLIGFVDEFFKALTKDPKTLKDIVDSLIALSRELPGLGKALGEFFATLASNKNNIENIKTIFDVLNNAIKITGFLLNWLSNEFRSLSDFMETTVKDIRYEWDREWASVVQTAKDSWAEIKEEGKIWREWWDEEWDKTVNSFKDAWNEITEEWDQIRRFWTEQWNSFVEDIQGFVNDIVEEWEMWRDRTRAVFLLALAIIEYVVNQIRDKWNSLINAAREVRDWIIARWEEIVDWFRALPGRIGALLAGAASAAWWGGVSIINNLIGGMTSRFGPLNNAINWIIGRIDGIGAALGRAGAAMARAGAAIVQGKVPGFAHGGRTPVNQPFWVGERGPELMSFNRPGLVTSHEESMRMVQDAQQRGSGNTVTVNVFTTEIDPRVTAAKLGFELSGRL